MATPRKTRASAKQSSEAYKRERKSKTTRTLGNPETKHKIKAPKKTGMRSYKSKLVLG